MRCARERASSDVEIAAGQGTQLDGVENVHFLAFGFEQPVLLEARKYARHRLHRKAQIVTNFVARHGQAELVGREAAGAETRREVDQEGGNALIGGLLRQQEHHLLIIANLAAHDAHQLAAQLRQLQGQVVEVPGTLIVKDTEALLVEAVGSGGVPEETAAQIKILQPFDDPDLFATLESSAAIRYGPATVTGLWQGNGLQVFWARR